ncbi:YceI family protein [Actinacidiphila acidipaludis]|uniref:YceI family protein n=1 Tax=Actinacidiphila acidipaludis TaxID=2873382 RepID=A0ABS7QDI2_9ACTN|nr:YceI family protein [Streptomyces acidipaludis]MBY8881225.1 YceI family protein [Streptomyces acidipaludis]
MPDTTGTTGTGTQNTPHPAGAVNTGRWTLDAERSSVRFSAKGFWGLAHVKGSFTEIRGEGEVLAGGAAHGTLTLRSGSLDTAHAKRDKHLRSGDFFDAEAHPEVVFTARSVTPAGADTVEVAGDLTIRGTSRPLTFTARLTDAGPDAVTLSADLPVRRLDFGMDWNWMGSLKDPAQVSVTARFVHQG